MNYTHWESLADNRAAWKQKLSFSLKQGELALKEISKEKRWRRKESSPSNATDDFFSPANAALPPLNVTHRTV